MEEHNAYGSGRRLGNKSRPQPIHVYSIIGLVCEITRISLNFS